MDYTERVDGFQIRDITSLLQKRKKNTPTKSFDIVKWERIDPPRKMFSFNDKIGKFEEKMIEECCYSIAFLEWNDEEHEFELTTFGLRILTSGLTQDAMDMIVRFAEEKAKEFETE